MHKPGTRTTAFRLSGCRVNRRLSIHHVATNCMLSAMILTSIGGSAFAQSIQTFNHGGPVFHVAFSPDDSLFASAGQAFGKTQSDGTIDITGFDGTIKGDGFIEIASPSDRSKSLTLTVSQGAVNSAVFSPDGKRIAAACDDGKVREFSLESKALVAEFALGSKPILDVTYSSDGSRLVTAGADGSAVVSNCSTKERQVEFGGHGGQVRLAVFCFNDKGVATMDSDGTVRLWSVESGDAKYAVTGHEGGATTAAASQDARFLATGGKDGEIRVWDLATGKVLRKLSEHRGGVNSISFAPNGRGLVSIGADNKVCFWNLTTSSLARTKQMPGICVTMSHNGNYLAVGTSSSKTLLLNTSN